MRVRQAVNFAIDRGHLVELLGGPTNQRPTCQILPPNFQGYEPFCPYTLDPESGRVVGAGPRPGASPDRGGRRGGNPRRRPGHRRIAVRYREVMEYVTDVLAQIGLEPDLEIVHGDVPYFDRIYPPAPGTPARSRGRRDIRTSS